MKKLYRILALLAVVGVMLGCEICGDTEGEKYQKWPGGIIPYAIDPAFSSSDKEKIYMTITEWKPSGIVFEERKNPGDYICNIQLKSGMAQATNGYRKDSHIYLQENFGFRDAVHEIGHVICLPDEIKRKNRDDYIIIQWQNIKNGEAHNFYIDYSIPAWYYKFEYDIDSIMHYSQVTFNSEFGKWTFLVKNNPEKYIINLSVTDKDIEKVKQIYE